MNWSIKILIRLEIGHYLVPCRIQLVSTLNLCLYSWDIEIFESDPPLVCS